MTLDNDENNEEEAEGENSPLLYQNCQVGVGVSCLNPLSPFLHQPRITHKNKGWVSDSDQGSDKEKGSDKDSGGGGGGTMYAGNTPCHHIVPIYIPILTVINNIHPPFTHTHITLSYDLPISYHTIPYHTGGTGRGGTFSRWVTDFLQPKGVDITEGGSGFWEHIISGGIRGVSNTCNEQGGGSSSGSCGGSGGGGGKGGGKEASSLPSLTLSEPLSVMSVSLAQHFADALAHAKLALAPPVKSDRAQSNGPVKSDRARFTQLTSHAIAGVNGDSDDVDDVSGGNDLLTASLGGLLLPSLPTSDQIKDQMLLASQHLKVHEWENYLRDTTTTLRQSFDRQVTS